MKRVYMKPQIVTDEMLEEQLICASLPKGEGPAQTGGGLSKDRRGIFSEDDEVENDELIW